MMRYLVLLPLALLIQDDTPPTGIPKPTSAEVTAPAEVRVGFDHKIDASARKAILALVKSQSIPYYAFDWAGDQARPTGEPLGRLRIADAKFDDSTLILATDPHPRRAVYVVDWGSGQRDADAHYLYSGVEAKWFANAEATEPSRTLVIPRFAIQPGDLEGAPQRIELLARLDVPADTKTLVMVGNMPFEAAVDNLLSEPNPTDDGTFRLEIPLEATNAPIEVFAGLQTSKTGAKSEFRATWKQGDKTVPVATSQTSLPWLPTERPQADVPEPPYNFAGGDPAKGEIIFRSESAKCAACHAKDGKGGAVGPSLDMLKGRDAREIYQSIAEPSARIAPEYRTFTVARKDGQVAVGVMKTESFDAIRVMDINGQATIIPRKEIDEMQPSDTSTMPVGLAGAIGEAGMRDLIAYLLK